MAIEEPTVPATVTVLRDARLTDGRRVDVHVRHGLIERVEAHPQPDGTPVAPGTVVHDLDGRLLLPAMAEPHAHLDKALLADDLVNHTGDLAGAIDAMNACDPALFAPERLARRVRSALDRLLVNGVTAVRSHVNVGEGGGVASVRVVDQVRREYAGLMDIQLVALLHSPLTGRAGAGNRAALDEALGAGIDLVGGCPHLDEDGAGVIDLVLAAASSAGLGIDLHVDETLDPGMLTLRTLARRVTSTGFAGPVAASHCVSLAMQTEVTQRAVADEVAAAGIAVIPLPQTNLFLQGRGHPVAMPRALAPIQVLRRAGVRVAAGGDNVQDPFNPVGRSDPLETAALLVMAGHQAPAVAYELVSNEVRRVMGLAAVLMAPGDPADLVALPAPNERGAIADAPGDRMVFRRGRLVATSTRTSVIDR